MPSFKYIKFGADGTKEYFLASAPEGTDNYGSVHYRENGPAMILADGTEIYFTNGLKGRNDGPAVISPNGYQEYWIKNHLGRKDGPAIIYPDGGKDWIWNDHYHRKDGPAREFADGTKQYYYEGKLIEAANDKEFVRKIRLSSLL